MEKKPRGPGKRNVGPVCDVIVSRNVSAPAQHPESPPAAWRGVGGRRCSALF